MATASSPHAASSRAVKSSSSSSKLPAASRASAISGSIRTTRWTRIPASRAIASGSTRGERVAVVDHHRAQPGVRPQPLEVCRALAAQRPVPRLRHAGAGRLAAQQLRQPQDRRHRQRVRVGQLVQHRPVLRLQAAGGDEAGAQHRHAVEEVVRRPLDQLAEAEPVRVPVDDGSALQADAHEAASSDRPSSSRSRTPIRRAKPGTANVAIAASPTQIATKYGNRL